MKYYFLSWKDVGPYVSANVDSDQAVPLAHKLIALLDGQNTMPFSFVLKKLTRGKDGLNKSLDLSGIKTIWKDYQGNSLAYPMMSEKMKTIVEEHLTGEEGIDWIRCIVKGPDEIRKYYVLRFNKPLDVLNMEKTLFVGDSNRILRPCFERQKIEKYAVFTEPSSYDFWKIPSGFYINETLKKAMVKAKLIGLHFEEAKVA